MKVPAGSPPTFTTFTPRDGLGDEIWSTVGQGPDGFVWAGSASTLSRFDGYRWHELADAPGRSLVRDMANDRQGRLWVIFEREGLAYYDGEGWHRVGEARFHQRFSTVGEGESRELWVAHNDGLARLEGDAWVEDPGNPVGNLGRAIDAIGITGDGMKARRPDMIHAEVPDRAHVPFLDEPESLDAIRRFLADDAGAGAASRHS